MINVTITVLLGKHCNHTCCLQL